jgi:uncharacterized glyoxalase superfamily protein PhnB
LSVCIPLSKIIPYLFYRDLPAALQWLARTFGFTEEMRTGTPSGGMHGQMMLDGQRIMMGQGARQWRMASPHETGLATMGVFVYIDDVDTHYARAAAAGAEIVHPPHDESYARTYTARDLDGPSLVLHHAASLVLQWRKREQLIDCSRPEQATSFGAA